MSESLLTLHRLAVQFTMGNRTWPLQSETCQLRAYPHSPRSVEVVASGPAARDLHRRWQGRPDDAPRFEGYLKALGSEHLSGDGVKVFIYDTRVVESGIRLTFQEF